MRALALVLLVAACKEPTPNAPSSAPPDAGSSCVDQELSRRGLNQYGDPPETIYAGGTPLFDEKTGRTRDRIDHVLTRHPEIAKVCPVH